MKLVSEDQGWEDLANAIIIQAVEDYKQALGYLKRHPDCEEAKCDVERLERFFYRQWFELLTNLTPDQLLPRIWRLMGIERKVIAE